jgi:hypothetical protein
MISSDEFGGGMMSAGLPDSAGLRCISGPDSSRVVELMLCMVVDIHDYMRLK